MHNSWAQPIQDLEISMTAGTEEEEWQQRSLKEREREGKRTTTATKNKQMLHVRKYSAEILR